MRHFKICCIVFLLSLPVFLGPSGAYATICDRVVAIVNNDIITLHEVDTKMEEISGIKPAELKKEDNEKYLSTRWKVLDLLIDERIAAEKAKELGIDVSPEEIDAAIERIKKQNGLTQEEFVADLKERGISYEQYRKQVKQDLERMHLINQEVKSKIIIRDETVKQYYEKHRSKFSSPGEIHLAAIFLREGNANDPDAQRALMKKARDILAELKQGKDFSELARKYSQGPGAQDGGDLGVFKMSQLDNTLARIANALPVGGISEPIARDGGIQILKVLSKQEAGLKSLSQVREKIYDTLYKQEVNRRFASWIKNLREKAYIKIMF